MRRLFSRPARAPAAPPTTGGGLVYAVGDIHGRLDLLQELIETIRRDAAGRETERRPGLVFIGDYVDRGPDSAGVVETVLGLREEGRFEVRFLKGNHEAQLLAFLADAGAGPAWMEFGGADTLLSYGVRPPPARSDLVAWEAARQAFAEALPGRHKTFLAGLELALICGDYVFVHAGIRPGVPLSEQSEADMLWIRDDFLSSTRATEKVVVHGHTPEAAPHIGRNRIGIDTGAYATARLTAVRLCGTEAAFLQTGPRMR